MAEELLLPLLFKIAPSLLTAAAKSGISSLLQQKPVTKAIETTCATFPELEPLRLALQTWCKSEFFAKILEQMKAGSRSLSYDDVITSFISIGGFYVGDQTRASAEQVLNTFAAKLEEQLYASTDGLYLLAQRQETLFAEQRGHLETLGERILTIEQTRETTLRRLPVAEDRQQTPREDEIADHARLDVARNLVNQGRPAAARAILDDLRKAVASKTASPELLFRIATNLGACALQFNDYETANKEFDTALQYQPESAKGLANSALARLLLKKPDDASLLSKKACELVPRDPYATSVYIRVLYELNRRSQLESLVVTETWIAEDPTCALTLASVRYEQERYGDAEVLARASLHRSPDESQTLFLIARTILTPIQTQLDKDPPLYWRLPDETQRRLMEAESLISKAVDMLRSHDNPRRFHEALAARAVVRIMLGRYDTALTDCDRILIDVPNDENGLGNKGLLLLKLDRTADAIKVLERIKSKPETQIPLGLAYVGNKEPEKAIALLRPLFISEHDHDRRFEIADILLSAYDMLSDEAGADEIVSSLAKEFPNDARGLAATARHRRRKGNTEDAINLFREALAYAIGNLRELLGLELANTYFSLGRFSEAAELYREIVDKTADNPLTRKFIVSLFNAGLYTETLLLAQSLRGDREAIPVITEIEALVMQYIGDLDRAIDLFEKLSHIEPENISHNVRLVMLHLRRGNQGDARRILSSIESREVTDSKILLQIAQARSILGMSGILPLAYQARRLAPRDPEIHLAYVGLFLQREMADTALLDIHDIAPGSVVRLQSDNQLQTFTILETSDGDLLSGELAPTDPLASKLLGLKQGERVVLREGLEDLSYEIIEVQSKYVFAFQETLRKFSTWFPDHGGLFRVEIKENDLSKVKMAMDARERQGTQVLALYRDKHLTLGAFARLVGTPLIAVWGGLVNHDKGLILASRGNPDENRQDAALLTATDEIVLDLTCILTLTFLELIDYLPRRFKALLISQALVDEVAETLARNFSFPHPAMTVWKEGETYFRNEITPENYERDRQSIETIRAFLQRQCTVVPVRTVLDVDKIKLNQMQDLLGKEAIAAILVAKERNLPFYSDDLGLREVAKHEWQVSGFWTQTLLLDLRAKGLLSEDEYYKAVKKLLLAKYRFVSIDCAGLFWILNEAGFTVTPAVSRVFESLHGPECSDESAVVVLADLLKRLWLETILYEQKLLLLDVILNALTSGRDATSAIARLKIALKSQFVLIPLVLRPIAQDMDVWLRRRNINGGIIQL